MLFTTTSTRPCFASMSANSFSTSASTVWSTRTANAVPPRGLDELGGFVDRLAPAVRRRLAAHAAARAVDRRAGLAERARDAAARAARGARDDGDAARERRAALPARRRARMRHATCDSLAARARCGSAETLAVRFAMG